MALPMPINPFEQKSKVGLEGMALQPPAISKPGDLASGQSFMPKSMGGAVSPPAAPALPGAPAANPQAMAYLAPAMGGMGAGGSVQPTTSAPSAIMQTAGAGVAGAAAGALTGMAIGAAGGGPIGAAGGAAIGGLVALVSGGIQSYFGLKDAREQKRKQERDEAYIKKKNEEHEAYLKEQNALARSDNQEQLRYGRRQAALASQMQAYQSVLSILNKGMADDETLKQIFVERGR